VDVPAPRSVTATTTWCRSTTPIRFGSIRRGPRATAADGDSIVYDPNAFQWEHVDYTTPPASGLVVYEMHVGSFFKMDVSRGTSTTRPPSCRTCATSPSTRSSGG
jgi:hypothetical protein